MIKNNKGFTLVETLAAFVLISFVAMTLLSLLMNYKDRSKLEIIRQEYSAIKDEITKTIMTDCIINNKLVKIEAGDRGKTQGLVFYLKNGSETKQYKLLVHNDASSADYTELDDIYIAWGPFGNEVKYKIPSGLPEYDARRNATEWKKLRSVSIDTSGGMVKTSDVGDKTVYRVDINIGVTDLNEDYGIHLFFMTDRIEGETLLKNKARNSGVEAADEFTNNNMITNASFGEFTINNNDKNENVTAANKVTAIEITDPEDNTKTVTLQPYERVPDSHMIKIHCSAPLNEVCKYVYPKGVAVKNCGTDKTCQNQSLEPNKKYVLSYFYLVTAANNLGGNTPTIYGHNGTSAVPITVNASLSRAPTRLASDSITVDWDSDVVETRAYTSFNSGNTVDVAIYPTFEFKSSNLTEYDVYVDAIQIEEGDIATSYEAHN